jgi:hypothetical protein
MKYHKLNLEQNTSKNMEKRTCSGVLAILLEESTLLKKYGNLQ